MRSVPIECSGDRQRTARRRNFAINLAFLARRLQKSLTVASARISSEIEQISPLLRSHTVSRQRARTNGQTRPVGDHRHHEDGRHDATHAPKLAQLQSHGIKVPGADGSPIKMKVCMTKEAIEKFGGTTPQRNSSCHLENIQKSSSGMTADMVCAGPNIFGSGAIQASRSDDNHTAEKMHFSGKDKSGRPVEFTQESTSTFLGADCGDVKPGQFATE